MDRYQASRWIERLRAGARLLRWLGPWSDERAQPAVQRRTVSVRGVTGDFEAWVYAPARRDPVGAYLIAPGLHYAGPRDPRMNRFCSILAGAGFLVMAPFVPDYLALTVTPASIEDFERCLPVLLSQPDYPRDARPGLFSISFGSLLALRLAAHPSWSRRVGGVVSFGGYADWGEVVRFALTGEVGGEAGVAHDPLNRPVVFMNLLPEILGVPADAGPLMAAWRAYLEASWGRMELKVDGRHRAVARAYESHVPPALRRWYRLGTGLDDGGVEACLAAAERMGPERAYLDPRPALSGIRCPVHLVHGVDDDVIPYQQSRVLARAMPAEIPSRLYLTGLYGHTAHSASELRDAAAMAREAATLAAILRAIVTSATAGHALPPHP